MLLLLQALAWPTRIGSFGEFVDDHGPAVE